jgi:molybdopterin converting factor subunit 1
MTAPGITIHLRYFAAVREAAGTERATLILPPNATIADARAALAARHPALRPVLAGCVAARNRAFAAEDTILTDGDELVFIPPMAGG